MTAPDALLLIAPGCPHCAALLDALGKLVKEGVIGRLEVVNVAVHAEAAAQRRVRSVPWLQLGPFALEGARPPNELRQWAERAADPAALITYLETVLAEGGLLKAEELVGATPTLLTPLLARITDETMPLQVHLGISALMEARAGTAELVATLPLLTALSQHADHRVRSDACHYLGLTRSLAARAPLQERLDDQWPEVREIAAEALAEIPVN